MSFSRRQEQILAMKAASAPASGGGHTRTITTTSVAGTPVAATARPAVAGDTPAARIAATIAMRLRHDIQRLKQIKSIDRKIAAKREMLPDYQPWCDGLLDAGRNAGTGAIEPTAADDVLPTIMVWHLDVGDWTRGLALAEFVLRFAIPLPKRYERDAPTLVLELIADAALRAQARGDAFPLDILESVERLTDGIDMHDQPRAKLLKAIGAELVRAAGQSTGDAVVTTIDRAAAVLTRAQDLNDRVGVKTMLRGLAAARAAAVKGTTDTADAAVPENGNSGEGRTNTN